MCAQCGSPKPSPGCPRSSCADTRNQCQDDRSLFYTETVIRNTLSLRPKGKKKTESKKSNPNSTPQRTPSGKTSCRTECKSKSPTQKTCCGSKIDANNLKKSQIKKSKSDGIKSVRKKPFSHVASESALRLPESRSDPSADKKYKNKRRRRPKPVSQRILKLAIPRKQVRQVKRNPFHVKLRALHYHASERIEQLSVPSQRYLLSLERDHSSAALDANASPTLLRPARSKTTSQPIRRTSYSMPCLNYSSQKVNKTISMGSLYNRDSIARISKRMHRPCSNLDLSAGRTWNNMHFMQYSSLRESPSRRILEVPTLIRILEDKEIC